MAICTKRDQATGDWLLIDTVSGETRRFHDQPSWLYASLLELLRGAERIDAALERLQHSYERSETRATILPPEAA